MEAVIDKDNDVPDKVHPIDEKPPLRRLIPLGLQHVLVMYAGAVAVPLIIGGALKLPKDQIAMLINADLICCGIATLIQSLGLGKSIGIRLPVMMGVSFAAVTPLIAIGTELGIPVVYGSIIAAGIIAFLAAPLVSRMVRFFPPVVTGCIIAIIGLSLMRVAVNWAAGGPPIIMTPTGPVPNPVHGDLINITIAFIVLVSILLISKYGRGFIANIAVLLGLIVGYAISLPLGKIDLAGVELQPWINIVYPFQFGFPEFHLIPILTMTTVLFVIMVESTGMFLALGELCDRPTTRDDLTRGLRVDGLGTIIGGIFNTFAYTSFSQNVGLVGVTGVRSRWVTVTAGCIILCFGLLPKVAHVVASIPQCVLGGAGIVMFGMVAATGVRILSRVDYSNRHNLIIVAVSIGVGMIPLVDDKFFQYFPKALGPVLHSGILLTSIAALLLNLFFNGFQSAEEADREAAASMPRHRITTYPINKHIAENLMLHFFRQRAKPEAAVHIRRAASGPFSRKTNTAKHKKKNDEVCQETPVFCPQALVPTQHFLS